MNLNLVLVLLGWITSLYLVYKLNTIMEERPDQRLNKPCPWCGGHEVFAHDTRVLGSIATIGQYCTECEGEWRTIYKMQKEVRA